MADGNDEPPNADDFRAWFSILTAPRRANGASSWFEMAADARDETPEQTLQAIRRIRVFSVDAVEARHEPTLRWDDVARAMVSLPSVEDLARDGGVHERRVRLRTVAGMDLVAFAQSPCESTFVVLGVLVLPGEAVRGREARLFILMATAGSCFMTAETYERATGGDAREPGPGGAFPIYEVRTRDGAGGPRLRMERR